MNQPRKHDTQYSSIHQIQRNYTTFKSDKYKCHIKYYYICYEVQHTKTHQCKYAVFYHDDDINTELY